MVDLKAKTAFDGLLPLRVGQVELVEEELGVLTSLQPWGDVAGFSKALQELHGVEFPKPNRTSTKAGARAIWFGRGEALLVGPAPEAKLAKTAAVVDVSDGWGAVRLSGEGAVDVLARLVPVDLREATFKRGHTIRTQIFHISASISRVNDGFLILVFRSMAGSLVHDMKQAMETVAARG